MASWPPSCGIGSIEFRHHMNVNAYHMAGAIEHLANPGAECGRD